MDDSTAVVDGFSALGLAPSLTRSLSELGYEEPTPIQSQAIPALISGRDVLGQAGTGTGKTAAFALPILQRLSSLEQHERQVPSALILVPTRELAMQVAEAVHKYGKTLGVHVLPIYGGQAMQLQLRALRRGVDVVVATPGRIVDHITRGSIDLSRVRMAVLDEADEMLDMGFAEDLEKILGALPADRQTALFSATVAPRIDSIARSHLKNPLRITIEREKAAATGEAPRIREVAYIVPRQHKLEALARVLEMEQPTAAIIFCRTRGEVDQLADTLGARGYSVDSLHGGLEQEQRDRVMRRFRDSTVEIVVATDVAARGLDIEHLSHVVNYDVPTSSDAYVHRIGRTGRAGRDGVALTFLEPKEQRHLRGIEHSLKRRIAVESVPTGHDIRARRMERMSAKLREELEGGDYAAYHVVVDTLATDYHPLDIASAAMKLASAAEEEDNVGSEPLDAKPEPEYKQKQRDRGKHGDKGAKSAKTDKVDRGEKGHKGDKGDKGKHKKKHDKKRQGGGDLVRLFVPVGKKAGVRPADLVGAIANESGVSARSIGTIEISDGYSLVEVPDGDADDIIAALSRTTIRGVKRPKVRRERY